MDKIVLNSQQDSIEWEKVMGLRFRKSINLGGGFKVNLSKSGIEHSWQLNIIEWI